MCVVSVEIASGASFGWNFDRIWRRGLMHSDVCVCVDEHSDCEHDVSVFG